jgi:hypothetical protein
MEEDYIIFHPFQDNVLGVFGNEVHIKSELNKWSDNSQTIVIITTVKEYLRVHKNWINDKKRICEAYDHYCGVGTGPHAKRFVKLDGQIDLNVPCKNWDDNDEDTWNYEKIMVDMYFVEKFEDTCDLEHG